jgi:hypothetical protein
MHELVSLARQTRLVFGRSPRAGLREPALAFVFPLAFPLLIIGLFSQVYARSPTCPASPPVATWAGDPGGGPHGGHVRGWPLRPGPALSTTTDQHRPRPVGP